MNMDCKSIPMAFLAASAVLIATIASSQARAASTHDLAFNAAIQKKNFTKNFDGSFQFDVDSLSGVGTEVLRDGSGLEGLQFDFYGRTYTTANTAGTRAVFVDGDLVGVAFKFLHRNGKKYRVAFDRLEVLPTQKQLGTASTANFSLVASSSQNFAGANTPVGAAGIASAPSPMAASGGLALLASMVFARRRKRLA